MLHNVRLESSRNFLQASQKRPGHKADQPLEEAAACFLVGGQTSRIMPRLFLRAQVLRGRKKLPLCCPVFLWRTSVRDLYFRSWPPFVSSLTSPGGITIGILS